MAPAGGSRRPSPQTSSLPAPLVSSRKPSVPARPHTTLSPSLDSQPSATSLGSAPSGQLTNRAHSFSSVGSGGSDNIKVAVRLRPFSEKERSRGDREVWGVVGPNTIGVTQQVGIRVKYAYDTVFGEHATNSQVYSEACRPVVEAAVDGFNGTVFAYGVTSSGKTHTITGTRHDPGFVQRTLEDVFEHVAAQPEREFLLGLSIMEIYNEELRDLLDPTRHLKLREDPKQGFFVEGGKEETVVSLEHALAVVHIGQHYRTTSATMMNTDSSRSHTILRLRLESSPRPDASDPLGMQPRTLSFLNIIDLAGSESAKVSLSKGQSREGAFINRSLLTLGTVISKLSEGHAAHVPFRDSKLTRLLCSSLTGSGAKVAVIATITPASSQAEETHNTLKFATRAKKVEVKAERNQIEEQSSLLLRYQQEIEALRAQLDDQVRANRDAFVSVAVHDPLHPEVRNLQERLEEEHQALLAREVEVAGLHGRVSRLTQLIIRAVRSHTLEGKDSLERRHLLRAYWRPAPVPDELEGPALSSRHHRGPALQTEDLASSVAAIRCAGDLFPGDRLAASLMQSLRAQGNEQEVLSQQVLVMAGELEEQLAQLTRLRRLQTARPAGSPQPAPQPLRQASLAAGAQAIGNGLQPTSSMSLSTKLAAHVRALQQQHQAVVEARAAHDGGAAPLLASNMRGVEETAPGRDGLGDTPGARAKPRRFTSDMLEQLSAIDQDVTEVMAAEADRDAAVVQHTQLLTKAQSEMSRLEQQAVDLAEENAALRAESDRLEARDAALQGYGLDDMHNDQLSQLIMTLTQAVERVRITVQLRRLQASASASAEQPQRSDSGAMPSPASGSTTPDGAQTSSPVGTASARTTSGEQPPQEFQKSASGRFPTDGGNADRLAALRRLSSQRSGIPGPPSGGGTPRMSSQ